MLYEIRARKMSGDSDGSTSLDLFFRDKHNAVERTKQLNRRLPNMFFVNEVQWQDR